MAQIFGRGSNSLARVSIAVVLLLLGGVIWAAYKINAGSFTTDVGWHPTSRCLSATSIMSPMTVSIADTAIPPLKLHPSPVCHRRKPA